MNSRPKFSSPFKYFFVGLLMLGVGSLFGCSQDPEHRIAYKEFLQEILAKQGYSSLPALSSDQEKALGQYALSYQQLYDFTQSVEKSVAECATYMDGMSKQISNPQDIMNRREEIAAARDFMALIPGEWDDMLEKAKAQKAELTLHEEVAPLYDELFAKYTDPVEQIKPLMLAVVETLNSNLALADYLKENEEKIQFQGNMIICNDEAVHERVNQLLADINVKSQELYALENSLSRYMIINKD